METIKDLGSYTFPALFKNAVKKFSDCDALSLVNGEPMTYRELAVNVERTAKMLVGLGLRAGSKIAIFSTSMPNWGVSYVATVKYGYIAVPLLPDFSALEVESILTHCGVDALIVSDGLYKKIESLGEKLPPVIIKIDDFSVIRAGSVVKKICDAKKVLSSAVEQALSEGAVASAHVDTSAVYASDFDCVTLSEPTVSEEDTASIIYTSGTTGRSKGVELSHRNLVWNAVQCQTVYRVNKMDRCLSFLPMSHVYEFTIDFAMQIMNGAHVFYLGHPPTVSVLLPEIQRNEFTAAMYKVPFFKKAINRAAGKKLKAAFGGRIQFFGIGGAKVDSLVERFMKDAKFPYAIGYGLTETAPLLAGSSPMQTIPGTVGPVVEGVTMRLCNPDKDTGIGEVVVKGPNVMKGYYKDPALTAASFTTDEDSCGAGYFRTGDLGTLKKMHGLVRLSLKGRSKNMILGSSGENIYPEDIEFVLNQHPLVSESLVVQGDAGLVALVHLDEEKLKAEAERRALTKQRADAVRSGEITLTKAVGEALGDAMNTAKQSAADFQENIAYQMQTILGEIQFFVNSKVNKSSKISSVEQIDEFEKTASQKIKRYKYEIG